ncbi:MAG: hypothetical protein ACOYD6_07500 [Limnochordia bacterium]|jgi:hypothetical protein
MLWSGKRDEIREIQGAIETIKKRKDMSPEAKERGIRSLQRALERVKLKLAR